VRRSRAFADRSSNVECPNVERHRSACLASEKGKEKRQKNTQNDRGRERKVEREVPAFDREVARKPAQGDAKHDEQADAADYETNDEQQLAH
jgi:hypothetical protein